jgi:hypothetical protein
VHGGQTIPHLVVVPVGTGGTVTLHDQAGTHLVVDVFGYFTDGSATDSSNGLFVALTPGRRLADGGLSQVDISPRVATGSFRPGGARP